MTTTAPLKIETQQVPGSLHYEVRGSGPVLLMMPGGPAEAGAFRKNHGGYASHATEFAVRLRMVLEG